MGFARPEGIFFVAQPFHCAVGTDSALEGNGFELLVGIAHAPAYVRMEVKPGKPLGTLLATAAEGHGDHGQQHLQRPPF